MRYLIDNNLALKSLIVILFFPLAGVITDASALPYPSSGVFQKCKEINASFEVIKDQNAGDTNSVKIDLKEVQRAELMISLVGPKKLFLRDVREDEIKNLSKGTYSLVIVGREESAGYCPSHFQVVIK